MKTTFSLQQVKELISLSPAQQQGIIDYSDSLAAATDDEIASSTIADDAPEMIRDIHRRSVRRARSAISRRNRSLKSGKVADNQRLSHGANRRLQWFRETILPQIGRAIGNIIAEARNAFSTLSPVQTDAVSRQAYNLLLNFLHPLWIRSAPVLKMI